MSDTHLHPSMRAAIASLGVGETYAKCERLVFEHISRSRITEDTAALRNTLASALRRAADETGYQYVIETGNFLTASRDLMLVAAVTRMPSVKRTMVRAREDEDDDHL